ncbi:Y-family DNA polymerase [Adhaeretor mobilis]|uniref:DNA polymerase IV n=1 Tax=Adhaeretor mobilis TaxID=1930276 RepID=A0A517MU42_9BACT|nr:DNA polymerase [Adhaeretor mobilis]QDS98399.1 DNA polymerase IV [Adhaeretor mobilis]
MPQLRSLFLDMNSYFASAEQQLNPALRGKPVAVVPSLTDATCCIAVSYEARPFGVRTGTNVGQARRMCPGLQLVEGRHENYITLHHQIIKAVETVLPVDEVCSIDEMHCRLSPQHREVEAARGLAAEVKRVIAEQVGPYLRCSIGLAPNHFLGKVASNMQKPNGLVVITRDDLPNRLYQLELDDLPGIGRNMLRRLQKCGIRTMQQLCSLSRKEMREAWKSVVGEQYWLMLRGDQYSSRETTRRTVGHSHVLPPKLRTDGGAYAVLVRLLHKAAARLRTMGFLTSRMAITIKYVGEMPNWTVKPYVGQVQDTPTLLNHLNRQWSQRPPGGRPLQAAITLLDLKPAGQISLPLFEEDRRPCRATEAMDLVNEKLGLNALYFASMHDTREAAPMRIAFTNIPDVQAEMSRPVDS